MEHQMATLAAKEAGVAQTFFFIILGLIILSIVAFLILGPHSGFALSRP